MSVKIGDRFVRLLVVGLIKDQKNPKARCLCDCGNEVTPQRGALANGRAKSCGCLRVDLFIERNTTHGMHDSPLYSVWRGMRDRCQNASNPSFSNYGGRGIAVSAAWGGFEQFVLDMGARPNRATLERKDTNGDYCKENCIWADWAAQASNKRVSKRWEIDGIEYRTSGDAAKALGVDASTINKRVNGRLAGGKFYAPVDGYASKSAYVTEAPPSKSLLP